MNRMTFHLAVALTGVILLPLQAPLPAAAQEVTTDTRLVQISLLVASKGGDSDLSDLPANTRQAIEDIRDFLPFKSYRIIDSSLVRALVPEDRGRARQARTFINGPNDTQLQVTLFMIAEKNGTEIYVRDFQVNRPPQSRLFAVTPEEHRDPDPDKHKPAVAPRATDLIDLGPLITTSFTAKVGQTVVVGSSRLNGGNEALIVLFTALP